MFLPDLEEFGCVFFPNQMTLPEPRSLIPACDHLGNVMGKHPSTASSVSIFITLPPSYNIGIYFLRINEIKKINVLAKMIKGPGGNPASL